MALNSNQIKAQQAFETIMSKASTMRAALQAQRAILSTNGGSADIVLNALRGVKSAREIMAAAVSTAGLNAYARLLYDDPGKDFVADANAAVAACDTLVAWIAANFPKDASGYLLKDKLVNGELQPRVFTAAAMSGLVAQMDALIAAL